MKKIIFGLQTMVMGGVEKELISIMRHLDKSEWDVSLVLMYVSDYTIVNMIPDHVKVINLDIDRKYYCSDTITAAWLRLKQGHISEGLSLIGKKTLHIGQTGSNIDMNRIPQIKGQFDTAVCFHMHSPIMVKYMTEKITASKNLAWIHNDFSTSGYQVNKIAKYLKRYDSIIGVSAKITDEFKALCPELASRALVVYNALDRNEIKSKANEQIEQELSLKIENKLFLLTVGRLEEQKGYDIAVEAAAKLKAKGIDFLWAFIGEGSKFDEIKRLITNSGLDNNVVLLGRKDNPYCYMKACDIYVQPSRHEGYPLTVLEAKALAKPIICTDFAGAREQINDDINGVVVARNNPETLAVAIEVLYRDELKQIKFRSGLNSENNFYNDFSDIISHF